MGSWADVATAIGTGVAALANIVIAGLTAWAAREARRSAQGSRVSAEAARAASAAAAMHGLRSLQPEVSAANRALAQFFRAHPNDWFERFRHMEEIEKHRQTNRKNG